MAERAFFGIPYWVIIPFCLIMTAVWVRVWPRKRISSAGGFRTIALRWFHALTWLLLTFAAVVAGFGLLGGEITARWIALGSLAVYLIFIATLVTSKPA